MWITRISSCRTWVEIVMRKIRFAGVCRYFSVSLWQLRAQLTPQNETVSMLRFACLSFFHRFAVLCVSHFISTNPRFISVQTPHAASWKSVLFLAKTIFSIASWLRARRSDNGHKQFGARKKMLIFFSFSFPGNCHIVGITHSESRSFRNDFPSPLHSSAVFSISEVSFSMHDLSLQCDALILNRLPSTESRHIGCKFKHAVCKQLNT